MTRGGPWVGRHAARHARAVAGASRSVPRPRRRTRGTLLDGGARGDPGASRRGCAPGGRLSPLAGGAHGWLRRRRRVLRDLRLSDHVAAVARGGTHRDGVVVRVLGAARAADPARGARDGAVLRGRDDRVRAGELLGAVLRGDAREHGVRAELASGRRGGRLHGVVGRTVPGAALLVAIGRGAVLPAVAGADRGCDRGRPPPHGAAEAWRVGDRHGDRDRAEPRVLDRAHVRRSGRGVLRYTDTDVGARRRRLARARSPEGRAGIRRPFCAVVDRARGDRDRRGHLQR